jgi:hypothetical protein
MNKHQFPLICFFLTLTTNYFVYNTTGAAEVSPDQTWADDCDFKDQETTRQMFAASQYGMVSDLPAMFGSMTLQPDIDTRNALKKNRTMLMIAAWNGRAETVSWLLQKGACTEIRDNEGLTPFLCAVFGHKIRTSKSTQGYDYLANQCSLMMSVLLQLPGQENVIREELVKTVTKYQNKESISKVANRILARFDHVQSRELEFEREVLREIKIPETGDPTPTTQVFQQIQEGNLQELQKELQKGFDPNQEYLIHNHDQTAIQFCAFIAQSKIFRYLIQSHGNRRIFNYTYKTIYCLAITGHKSRCTNSVQKQDYLLEQCAEIIAIYLDLPPQIQPIICEELSKTTTEYNNRETIPQISIRILNKILEYLLAEQLIPPIWQITLEVALLTNNQTTVQQVLNERQISI